MNNKLIKENVLDALEDALKSHDWFYHFSESPTCYRQGKAENTHITYLISLASSFGLSDEAKAMHSQYYNSNYLQKMSPIRNLAKKASKL